MAYQSIEVKRLSPIVGAEMSGVDRPKDLGNRQFPVINPRAGVWIPVQAAPFDRDLELGVVEGSNVRAFDFPCRRTADGWVKAVDREPLGFGPTHWRDW